MSTVCNRALIVPACVGLGLCVLATRPALAASEWIEPRSNDAGEYAVLAQIPIGEDKITAINGHLDAFETITDGASGGGSGVGLPFSSGQDFFQIYIPSPADFRAHVVSASFDSKLYLFNLSGQGLLSNDDIAPGNPLSLITPAAADGSFLLTAPGIYAIGISGVANFPISAGGAIFPTLPFDVQGPTGPGGGLTHIGWGGDQSIGAYRIEFLGAYFVPAPGTAGMVGLMGLAALRRRRARG